jgi:DNA-binding GntR family transcriptional regulator
MENGPDGIVSVKVDARALPDIICERLRERIHDGTFGPGMELRQEELANRFGASRIPLREAMKRLEAEGLITLRPRRGYVVSSFDMNEIREIFDLRVLIEEHAGYHATLARTPEDIAATGALLRKLEALKPGAPTYFRDWATLNRAFHERLFSSSRRRHLTQMAGTLRDKVELYIRVEASITGNLRDAQAEHRKIFSAFSSGNAKLAAKLSREHCESTACRLLEGLKSR